MPSPVSPDDLAEVMPGLIGGICHKVINGFRTAALIYQWFSWMYDEGGDFNQSIKDELCGIRCTCSSSTSSGTPIEPPKVNEFKELIVKPDDTLCTAFMKTFVKFPALFYKWFKSLWNSDGTFSDEFRRQFCDAVGPQE